METSYQNTFNVNEGVSQGATDRARGGILKIEVTIPSETVDVKNGVQNNEPAAGTVTTAEMKTTIEIDWELLPLVNVAGYAIGEEQTGPDTLPYPPDKLEFSFS